LTQTATAEGHEMKSSDLLVDAFERIRHATHHAVEGLAPDVLAFRPHGDSNSIAWLVWHLARIQDDHVADVAGSEQIWTARDWYAKFALPFPPSATGYGHSSEEVAAVRAGSAELLGYFDEVHEHTIGYLGTLSTPDFERIVDESWDPPVTLGVRLVSVVTDDLQHAGQAAYVRGLAERSTGT
jgi:hypothetical protein